MAASCVVANLFATPIVAQEPTATFFGGSSGDIPRQAFVHPLNGDIYISGSGGVGLPVSDDAWITNQGQCAFSCNGMLARFKPDLSELVAATYLERGWTSLPAWPAMTVDPSTGDILVGGNLDVSLLGRVVRLKADLSAAVSGVTIGSGAGGFRTVSGITVHPLNGDVYVTGSVSGGLLTDTSGGAQENFAGGETDRFVARLAAADLSVVQASYLGGSGRDSAPGEQEPGPGIVVHPQSGDIYVIGQTSSTDFPTTPGALQESHAGPATRGFVTRFSADLATIRSSTYFGGDGAWKVLAIAIDASKGAVFIAGEAGGSGLPGAGGGAQGAPVFPIGGSRYGFVAELAADLSTSPRGSYYHSLNNFAIERLYGLFLLQDTGELLVAGHANGSAEPPALDRPTRSTSDTAGPAAVMARFSPDLANIVRSTWVGPADSTGGLAAPVALVADSSAENVYTTFAFSGADYLWTSGTAFPANPGSRSALLVRLPADLSDGFLVFKDGFEPKP